MGQFMRLLWRDLTCAHVGAIEEHHAQLHAALVHKASSRSYTPLRARQMKI